MKWNVLSLVLFAPLALAGLEDAKHSTVLSTDNFDHIVNSQLKGTLVAFFAPWCGHCKNLEPVWTQVASAFENDDRCKLGHLDADNPENRPVADRFNVRSFPTIKYIPADGSPATDYTLGRTVDSFLNFMNGHCGTDKAVGGQLRDKSGIVNSLDRSAAIFFLTDDAKERKDITASVRQVIKDLTPRPGYLTTYYETILKKFENAGDETKIKGQGWIEKEIARLQKIVAKGGLSSYKFDEFRQKINILSSILEAIKTGKKPTKADIETSHVDVKFGRGVPDEL